MIKYSDMQFMWSKNDNPDAEDNLDQFIAVAIGIDGTVQEVFGTYILFFDLLKSNYNVIDSSTRYNDGKFYVDFINNEDIIETLEAPEKIWALLLSQPDIFEIVRDARTRPSYLRDGIRYYIKKDWTYLYVDGSYEVSPPEGWSLPADANETEEERHAKQVLKANQIKEAYANGAEISPQILAEIERLGL